MSEELKKLTSYHLVDALDAAIYNAAKRIWWEYFGMKMYIMIYLTQKFINYLANTAIFSSVKRGSLRRWHTRWQWSSRCLSTFHSEDRPRQQSWPRSSGRWGQLGKHGKLSFKAGFFITLTRLPVGEAGGCCVRIRGSVHPLPLVDARVLPICLQT